LRNAADVHSQLKPERLSPTISTRSPTINRRSSRS
jgi:hypothetical protein